LAHAAQPLGRENGPPATGERGLRRWRTVARRRLSIWLPTGHTLPPGAWERRHRVLVGVLLAHVAALASVGLAVRADPFMLASSLGAMTALAVAAANGRLPRSWRSVACSFGLLTGSATLVHLTGGVTEAHFHFFVVVALLATYEAWLPFLLSLGHVLVHHASMGMAAPHALYSHHDLSMLGAWSWAGVHAVAIGALGVVCVACWRLNEEVRRASRRAHHRLERSEARLRVDVATRRAAEARLAYQATHDEVTGLWNRSRFELAAAEAHAGTSPFAVVLAQVTDLRVVSDALGRGVANDLLAAMAVRLREGLPATALLARFASDEFAILAPAGEDPLAVADDLQELLALPVVVGRHARHVSVHVGIAARTPQTASAEALLRDADAALSEAGRVGRDAVVLCDAGTRQRAVRRLTLEDGLRRDLEAGLVEVHYQPVVDLATGHVAGCEALARWRDAGGEPVRPDIFIPIAEESGLVGELGRQVLHTACAAAAGWPAGPDGHRPAVAVNVSPHQLGSSALLDDVAHALAAPGLAPELLCLEITESAVAADRRAAVRRLAALRELGVRIALDDFGVGQASLAHLELLPVDVLKIDRSFIGRLPGAPASEAVVAAILQLARGLGMRTVAEGVEHLEQAVLLRRLGCHDAQGYHFGRPAAEAALQVAWLPAA
jgi:diguanylate cyclase (GGDEF)-like protein